MGSSMWDGAETIDVYGRGAYLGKGQYLLEVVRCRENNGFKGDSFIAELKVLESTNDQNPPGSTADFVRTVKDKKSKEMCQRDVIPFVMAVLGGDPGDKQATKKLQGEFKRLMEHVTGEENPLAGKCVRCEAIEITYGDNAEKTFTRYKWTPAEAA